VTKKTKKKGEPIVRAVQGRHWTLNEEVSLTISIGRDSEFELPAEVENVLQEHAEQIAAYLEKR